ncbi:hypothetical protein ACTQV0_07505 [Selenomonas montiformis]|uniref:Uncharacterized protein n=1 Tax=Selenomonas montiformis TaxID=2652285 RepID=A0A6I2UZ45_9FIRM|nr:hypothetical protein [Selenomonas montiformis]MSV24536.1 hypothetical protein [Selenomonas montiformis]
MSRRAFILRLLPLLAAGIGFHYLPADFPVALRIGLSIPLILFLLYIVCRRAENIGLPRTAKILFCLLTFCPVLNYVLFLYLACVPTAAASGQGTTLS